MAQYLNNTRYLLAIRIIFRQLMPNLIHIIFLKLFADLHGNCTVILSLHFSLEVILSKLFHYFTCLHEDINNDL